MSNKPIETPIGKPEKYGARHGYQLFSEVWPDGGVSFYSRTGIYYENPYTGDIYIIPKQRGHEFVDAAREAETKRAVLENAEKAKRVAKQVPTRQRTTLEFVEAREEQAHDVHRAANT